MKKSHLLLLILIPTFVLTSSLIMPALGYRRVIIEPQENWPRKTGGSIMGSPLVMDINEDSSLDVIVGAMDNKVYGWHANGSKLGSHWPTEELEGGIRASPVVADVNQDLKLDILVSSWDGSILAISRDGTKIESFSLNASSSIYGSPIVIDNSNYSHTFSFAP